MTREQLNDFIDERIYPNSENEITAAKHNAVDKALADYAEDYADEQVASEAGNRDAAISAAIAGEVSNRNSAIASAIASEVSARNSAISTAISQEVNDRNTAIGAAIGTEVSNRNAAIDAAVLAARNARYTAFGAVYDSGTGTWSMHGGLVTGLTAGDMENICASPDFNASDIFTGAMQYGAKTNRPINTYRVVRGSTYPADFTQMARNNTSLEVFYSLVSGANMFRVKDLTAAFYGCTALRVVKYLDVSRVTNYAGFGSAFLNCGNLEECYLKGFDAQKDTRTGHETDGTLDFSQSPKLTRESLVFIVENAGTAYEKNLRIPSGIYTAWNADGEASPTWQEFTDMCVSKKISIHLA